MKPSNGEYTVAMPWYERDDFTRMLALADDANQMAGDYDAWHVEPVKVAEQALAHGRALQLVTIRAHDFLFWIKKRGLLNTAATRLQYVEALEALPTLVPSQTSPDHQVSNSSQNATPQPNAMATSKRA